MVHPESCLGSVWAAYKALMATDERKHTSNATEVIQMTQAKDATTTPVRPSIDRDADELVGNETPGRSVDDIAMDMAKRGKNEMKKDEADHSLFTK